MCGYDISVNTDYEKSSYGKLLTSACNVCGAKASDAE